MSKEVAVIDKAALERFDKLPVVKRVSNLLWAMEDRLQKALPKGRDVAMEISSVIATVMASKELQECTPDSIVRAAYDAFAVGLPVNKLGLAYLVPYGGVCTLQIGYRGYIHLMLNVGQVVDVIAEVAYENDEFYYTKGSFRQNAIVHKPLMKGDRGKLAYAYAIALMSDGREKPCVLDAKDIEQIAKHSSSYNKGKGPWISDTSEMWKKSAVNRLKKMLKLYELEPNTQFDKASQIDEAYNKLRDNGNSGPLPLAIPEAQPMAQLPSGDLDLDPDLDPIAEAHQEIKNMNPGVHIPTGAELAAKITLTHLPTPNPSTYDGNDALPPGASVTATSPDDDPREKLKSMILDYRQAMIEGGLDLAPIQNFATISTPDLDALYTATLKQYQTWKKALVRKK